MMDAADHQPAAPQSCGAALDGVLPKLARALIGRGLFISIISVLPLLVVVVLDATRCGPPS
ncbi:MAG: hypothetical protein JNK64_19950 [Myxococcales bacterium]|nr:hypothetical protein [Myxococcales bacterium]